MSTLKILLKKHYGLLIFIVFFLIFSFLTYKQYPITADEEFRYVRGKELLNFYLNSQPRQNFFEPKILPDQFYFYNLIQNIMNPKFYYEWFHLINLFFSLLIFIFFYFLLFSYSKNQVFSFVGTLLLFFTPSFSGHLAFNPVDMPFSVLFILNIYLIYYFRNTEFDFIKIITLGFTFWFLIGIRPLGFQIFLLFIIFSLIYKYNDKKYLISQFKNLCLISILSFFLLAISWPYIGINFFKNLYFTFSATASFDNWNKLILFNGELISKQERSWDYLFIYLGLTTPLYILILLIFSFINYRNLIKQFLLITLFINFIIYLLINPVIYNGLRHFLYLIPIIVLISLLNLFDIFSSNIKKKYKLLLFLAISLNISAIFIQIYKLFPLHYSYFNEISGGVEKNITKFETDYWGGSYKEAALYIRNNIATNNPEDVKVYTCNMSFAMDYYSFKKFLMTINKQEANFIVCSIPEELEREITGEIIKKIKLGNETFINIRKNDDKIVK